MFLSVFCSTKNFEKEKILIKETKEYENLIKKITLLNTQVDNNNFVEIVFENLS